MQGDVKKFDFHMNKIFLKVLSLLARENEMKQKKKKNKCFNNEKIGIKMFR